jgi:hypothetical protein
MIINFGIFLFLKRCKQIILKWYRSKKDNSTLTSKNQRLCHTFYDILKFNFFPVKFFFFTMHVVQVILLATIILFLSKHKSTQYSDNG